MGLAAVRARPSGAVASTAAGPPTTRRGSWPTSPPCARSRTGSPVGVTVFVEGEEEIGSDSLLTILERHSEKLRADAIVLADSGNWAIGEPALTVTLRGLIRVVVTITTLDHGVHSGMFGGAVPDAITTLVRLSPPCTTTTATSPSRA